MNIVEKNEGIKIPVEVSGTKVTFDDMLTIDLKRYQKDEETVIDISLNNDDMPQMGLGKWYLANITIPAKEYVFEEIKVENKQVENLEKESKKVLLPLDMEKVTLTLWEVPYNYGFYSEGGF